MCGWVHTVLIIFCIGFVWKGLVKDMMYFEEPDVEVVVFENTSDIADAYSIPEIPDGGVVW